jgi:hypothetical protein
MVNNTALAGALLQADVPLVADDVCAVAMGTVDPKTQVCAGYTNGGVDGCQGDRCVRRDFSIARFGVPHAAKSGGTLWYILY